MTACLATGIMPSAMSSLSVSLTMLLVSEATSDALSAGRGVLLRVGGGAGFALAEPFPGFFLSTFPFAPVKLIQL